MQHWNNNGSMEGPPTMPPPDIVENAANGKSFAEWMTKIEREAMKKRDINATIFRIIAYNTVSCPGCHELFPGWRFSGSDVVPYAEFSNPDRYYGVHFDHELVPDETTGLLKAKVPDGEEYIKPSNLIRRDAETAVKHLKCTNVSCAG